MTNVVVLTEVGRKFSASNNCVVCPNTILVDEIYASRIDALWAMSVFDDFVFMFR